MTFSPAVNSWKLIFGAGLKVLRYPKIFEEEDQDRTSRRASRTCKKLRTS